VQNLLKGPDYVFLKMEMERRLGRELSDSDIITVFEFKRTYDWLLKEQSGDA
jgi:hypothetical protein